MPKNEDNELSDLLSDLAAAQAKQEEELSALTGGGAKAKKQDAERIAEEELLAEKAAASTATVEADQPVDEATTPMPEPFEPDKQAVEEPAAEAEPDAHAAHDQEPVAAASSEDDALAAMAAAAGTEQGEDLEESHVAEMEAPIDLGVSRRRSHAHVSAAESSARGRGPQRRAPATNMKAVVAPVILTFGLLLIALALWGTLMLMGVNVPMSDRPDSGKMGLILAAAGWPMGLFLFIYAIFSLRSLGGSRRDEHE